MVSALELVDTVLGAQFDVAWAEEGRWEAEGECIHDHSCSCLRTDLRYYCGDQYCLAMFNVVEETTQ